MKTIIMKWKNLLRKYNKTKIPGTGYLIISSIKKTPKKMNKMSVPKKPK